VNILVIKTQILLGVDYIEILSLNHWSESELLWTLSFSNCIQKNYFDLLQKVSLASDISIQELGTKRDSYQTAGGWKKSIRLDIIIKVHYGSEINWSLTSSWSKQKQPKMTLKLFLIVVSLIVDHIPRKKWKKKNLANNWSMVGWWGGL